MIHLVTLNPALDLTLQLEKPSRGKIGKLVEAKMEAGGKALNIARFLKKWGIRPLTWLGTGGEDHPTHVLYRSLLKKEGLHIRFLGGAAPIRFNAVVDSGKTRGKFNHPGFELDLKTFGQLHRMVRKNDLLVLTGRLPQGMNPALYGSWIKAFNRKGVRTVVDTSGAALREALSAKPWFFKVNLFEFSEAIHRKLSKLKQVIPLVPGLIKAGLLHGAVTNGPEGALVWNGPEIVWAGTPKKNAASLVVGAGDGFLAGYLKGLESKKSFVDCVRLACAAGSTVALSGIGGFKTSLLQKQIKKVKVKRLP
jgi:1-phosphofructokinase family hexose kinase